jgi:hypothetical protein
LLIDQQWTLLIGLYRAAALVSPWDHHKFIMNARAEKYGICLEHNLCLWFVGDSSRNLHAKCRHVYWIVTFKNRRDVFNYFWKQFFGIMGIVLFISFFTVFWDRLFTLHGLVTSLVIFLVPALLGIRKGIHQSIKEDRQRQASEKQ